MYTYFPFAETENVKGDAIQHLLVAQVAGVYPNPTSGTWDQHLPGGSPRTVLNGIMMLVDVALACGQTVYIEQILNYDLFVKSTCRQVYYHRFWFPLKGELEANQFLRSLSDHLSQEDPDLPKFNKPAQKRRRVSTPTSGASTNASPGVGGASAAGSGVISTDIGPNRIWNTAQCIKFFAILKGGKGGTLLMRTLDLTMPQTDGPGQTGALVDPDDSDGDSDVSGDDNPPINLGEAATIPNNNPLQLLSVKDYFSTLHTSAYAGVSPDQLSLDQYWNNSVFRFPLMAIECGLIHTIPPNWAALNGRGALGLLTQTLPGMEIPKADLIQAISNMRDNAGSNFDANDLETMSRMELKAELYEQVDDDGSGGIDPTPCIPIPVRDVAHASPDATTEIENGEQMLWRMYPIAAREQEINRHRVACLKAALEAGTMTQDEILAFFLDTERQINAMYRCPAIAGMHPGLFPVYAETTSILATFHRKRSERGTTSFVANQLLNPTGNALGLASAWNETLGHLAINLRDVLNMLPAQATFILTAWLGTFIAYLPRILTLQLTFVLLGGSDKGKSCAMDVVASLIPNAAAHSCDEQSEKANTASGLGGVVFQDEMKELKNQGNKAEAAGRKTYTQQTTGKYTYDRLQLGTNGNPTVVEKIESDRRAVSIMATNGVLLDAMTSRCIQVKMAPDPEGAKCGKLPVECSSLPETSFPKAGVRLAFKALFAAGMECWTHASLLELHISEAYSCVFIALFTKIIPQSQFKLTPRLVKILNKLALANMVARVAHTVIQNPDHSPLLLYRSNAVVTMHDYFLASTNLANLTSTPQTDWVVIRLLKEHILVHDEHVPILIESNGYYVTSLDGPAALARCQSTLVRAAGIIAEIIGRLECESSDGTVDGKTAPVIFHFKQGEHKGRYGISVPFVKGKQIYTTQEARIMKFLITDVIADSVNRPPAKKYYHVAANEQGVVFATPILERLREPHKASVMQDAPALRGAAGYTPLTMTRAILTLEAMGTLLWRNLSDPFPGRLSNLVAHTIPARGGVDGSKIPDRNGPNDEYRLLPQEFYLETDDAELERTDIDDLLAKQCIPLDPSKPMVNLTRRQDMQFVPLMVMDTMLTPITAEISKALDGVLAHQKNITPPLSYSNLEPQETNQSRMATLFQYAMAYSGEYTTGDVVFAGNNGGPDPYQTITVNPIVKSLSVRNANRRMTATSAVYDMGLSCTTDLDIVAPSALQFITIAPGPRSDRTEKLHQYIRRENLVGD
jgi:hypothetical protein